MTPTTDQLKRAYDQHHKPEWPSFEHCLSHPIYSRILKIKVMAEVMEASDKIFESPEKKSTHSMFCVCPPCMKAFKEKTGQPDRKRLASGEKPD